jgi:hypothetical protein
LGGMIVDEFVENKVLPEFQPVVAPIRSLTKVGAGRRRTDELRPSDVQAEVHIRVRANEESGGVERAGPPLLRQQALKLDI